MNDKLATSTIAMTIYNILATIGGPANPFQLYCQAKKMQHPILDRKQFDAALMRLNRMRLVQSTQFGFMVVDRSRRLIVSRDRSDIKLQSNGEVTGGWNAWCWRDPAGVITRVFRERKNRKVKR